MSIENDPQLFGSGYERNSLDRYWTHPWMTQELFHLAPMICHIPEFIWECAAGRGDISRVIKETGRKVYSTDINMSEFDSSIGPNRECNFLEESIVPEIRFFEDGVGIGRQCNAIITNPPYSNPRRGIADEFIEHGLWLMTQFNDIEFMAMLLRSEFKSGKSARRRYKFGKCPYYQGEIVLTTRPRWDYGDPNAPENAAPRHNFSWFLWGKKQVYGVRHPVQLFSYLPKGFKA